MNGITGTLSKKAVLRHRRWKKRHIYRGKEFRNNRKIPNVKATRQSVEVNSLDMHHGRDHCCPLNDDDVVAVAVASQAALEHIQVEEC